MTGDPLKSRREAEARIVDRAGQDPEFRRRLLATPQATIEAALGVTLPSGIRLTVLEETDRQLYLVLPAPAAGDGELTDSELAAVSGGAAASGEKAFGSLAARARKAAQAGHQAETLSNE